MFSSSILKQLYSVKYLGVTIEQKLTWNEHIGNVVKKVNSSTAFLRRNLQVPQYIKGFGALPHSALFNTSAVLNAKCRLPYLISLDQTG